MAWLAENLQSHSCLIKSFVYICEGLVLVRRHILKPPNVAHNILSEFVNNLFTDI